jgi:hypothetical protein
MTRTAPPPAYQPFTAEPRFARPVVQPKVVGGQPKFYPNLNASAATPVDRSEIYRLHSFAESFRLVRGSQHGQLVANSKYIFCRMLTGEMLVHPTYRHPVIAGGKPVLYAGEMFFNNGTLDWWSNGSGNYRPDPEHADQAGLPMGHFYTYQDVLKGRHKARGKGSGA